MNRDFPELAVGHSQQASLKRLPELSPPLLEVYRDRILLVDFAESEYEINGSRRRLSVSLPTARWLFPILTEDELDYFRSTIFLGQPDVLVTVRTYYPPTKDWKDYNATMLWPTITRDRFIAGDWREIEFEFIDLVEL
jgi:hypothetical protein